MRQNLLCGALALSATACTSTRDIANSLYLIKPAFINVPAEVGSQTNPDIPPPGVPDTSVNPKTSVPYPLNLATYSLVATQPPSPYVNAALTSSVARNNLKDALVRRSDLICHYTKAHIAGNSDLINFGLGETTTILGTIGGLVTAATPARAFSGAAAFVNATRGQVNSSFYQNVVQYAILTQNDKEREAILTQINEHNKENASTYTVEALLRDIERYHYNCSFYAGLEGLTKDKRDFALPAVKDQVHLPDDNGVKPAKAGNAAPAKAAKPAPANPDDGGGT